MDGLSEDVEMGNNPQAQRCGCLTAHEIVGPQPTPLAVDQAGLAQQAEMMRDRRLLDRQHGFQVADTHITLGARQNFEDLQPDGMRQDAQIVGELLRRLRWDGAADGRLRFSYTLRTIFNCSDELIEASVERAQRLGTPLQMHIAEIREENEHTRATRGTTTVRHLARFGALGPWFLGAHAVWLEDEEIGLLAASGAAV